MGIVVVGVRFISDPISDFVNVICFGKKYIVSAICTFAVFTLLNRYKKREEVREGAREEKSDILLSKSKSNKHPLYPIQLVKGIALPRYTFCFPFPSPVELGVGFKQKGSFHTSTASPFSSK